MFFTIQKRENLFTKAFLKKESDITLFNNLFSKYLKPVEIPVQPKEEKLMGTPADTLVNQHPDRVSQLLGPVYNYLKPMMPYSQVPQNLYMAVFYPVARKWPPNAVFADEITKNPKLGGAAQARKFTKQNPGIVTVQDYINHVEAASKYTRPVLSVTEQKALDTTAGKLGVASDSLYKLINFESSWNPLSVNLQGSGARGLIQFMPSTAKGMGFAAAVSIMPLLIIGGIVYFLMTRKGII
jgi:hypothetical protein